MTRLYSILNDGLWKSRLSACASGEPVPDHNQALPCPWMLRMGSSLFFSTQF